MKFQCSNFKPKKKKNKGINLSNKVWVILSKIPRLMHLNLLKLFNIWVNDDQHRLHANIKKCSLGLDHMKQLKIGSENLNDHLLRKILKNLSSLYLRNLDLTSSKNLTSNSLEILGRFMPDLVQLNLSDCIAIDDYGIRHLRHLEHLMFLALTGVPAITDQSILYLMKNGYLNRLVNLRLSGCRRLTDKSVIAIGKNCTMLQMLDISCLPTLTKKTLNSLAKNCKNLQYLNIWFANRLSVHLESVFSDVSIMMLKSNVVDLRKKKKCEEKRIVMVTRYLKIKRARKAQRAVIVAVLVAIVSFLVILMLYFGWN